MKKLTKELRSLLDSLRENTDQEPSAEMNETWGRDNLTFLVAAIQALKSQQEEILPPVLKSSSSAARNAMQEVFRIQQQDKISLSIPPGRTALILDAHVLRDGNWWHLEYDIDYIFDGQTVHLLKPRPGCDIRVIYETRQRH